MATDRWHLIAGEYPPMPGGVGDYTALLAAALAAVGSNVHVWTTRGPDADVGSAGGVRVHRPVEGWSPADLARLDDELRAFATPRRLVVQYAPNVWGYKGMNIGFCRWLLRRRRLGDDVRVMFHEVWYPWKLRDKPTRWMLALGHRYMVRTLMDSCSSAYVSIPAWEPLLRASEKGARRPITWLPVPSTIPVVDAPEAVAELRGRLAPKGQTLIGTFGTFGGMIGEMLAQVLLCLLNDHDDRVGMLLGRGSDRFAESLASEHPDLAGRLTAAAGLSPSELSIHLQACDLLVQPYPDGLTSRRTSLMAGLAHGLPIVSNLGTLSEGIWERSKCPVVAPNPDPLEIAAAAESVLTDQARRTELGVKGRTIYTREFDVERTVERLRGLSLANSPW